jgi:hypothetical protein
MAICAKGNLYTKQKVKLNNIEPATISARHEAPPVVLVCDRWRLFGGCAAFAAAAKKRLFMDGKIHYTFARKNHE